MSLIEVAILSSEWPVQPEREKPQGVHNGVMERGLNLVFERFLSE